MKDKFNRFSVSTTENDKKQSRAGNYDRYEEFMNAKGAWRWI
jgi:hypothetical protein